MTESCNARTIAILPLGAHEQHGPHLPFETDALIAAGISARLAAALPRRLDVRFLPVEPTGYSVEHMGVAGTRSFTYGEAIERWLGMAEGLANRGLRKLMLLNAHGGNSPLLTIVATEARIRFNMLCVVTHWTRFGIPDGFMTPQEKAVDIHGGDIETSVMLALCPEKVDMARATDFPSAQSDFIRDFTHLRAYGPHAFGWKMADLSPLGVTGNAGRASAARGEQLLAPVIRGLVELVEDIDRFPAETLT